MNQVIMELSKRTLGAINEKLANGYYVDYNIASGKTTFVVLKLRRNEPIDLRSAVSSQPY